MWQKLTGVLVLFCLVGSRVLTEGFQTGIVCQLINDAGGVVQTFNQFDCSSCWFHCIMSPTCVNIYYTYDGACNAEESQVEKFTDQSEEDFRSPSGTCLQLDKSFGKQLTADCPFKTASLRRILNPARARQECSLYTSKSSLVEDLGDTSCHECLSRCQFYAENTDTPCANFYYSNDNICYGLYPSPDESDAASLCDNAEAQLYIPLEFPCIGSAKGEPHFRGFGNQPFEFQGFSGGTFNLYSDPAHQVNVLLTAIGHPDLTYVTAVGITYGPNRVQVLVNVQHCNDWEACHVQVRLDNKVVEPSEGHERVTAVGGGLKLEVSNAFQGAEHVHVFTPALAITITKGIGGLHLDVGLSAFPGVISVQQVHGLLGQTIRWPPYPYAHLLGDEMDYVTSHLFATDSMFGLYAAANASVWHKQY